MKLDLFMKKNEKSGLILLIEDNRNLSEVMGELFEQKGFSVDFASDGLDGYRLACQNSYDVIVLDLSLPRMDGLQICQKLRTEAKVSTPILMLTARDAVSDKVLGFEAGADDYLIKPFAIQELEARIRALIRRERRQLSHDVYQIADLILDTDSLSATRAGKELNLSPIALRLLTILMRESPRVVSRRDIEREIWGDDLPESDTLRSHIYNLRKSLDGNHDIQLLHTVQTVGYRIVDLSDQTAA